MSEDAASLVDAERELPQLFRRDPAAVLAAASSSSSSASSAPTTSGMQLIQARFGSDQHPFSNEGEGGGVISPRAVGNAIVLNFPAFWFERNAAAFVHIARRWGSEVAAIGRLMYALMFFQNLYRKACARSSGVVREKPRKEDEDGDSDDGDGGDDLIGGEPGDGGEDGERSEVMNKRKRDNNEHNGQKKKRKYPPLPPETRDGYPLVQCIEMVPQANNPDEMALLRVMYFYNSTRVDACDLVYEHLYTWENYKQEHNSNARRMAAVDRSRADYERVDRAKYRDFATVFNAHPERLKADRLLNADMQKVSYKRGGHPLNDFESPWNPYNAFSLENACESARWHNVPAYATDITNYFAHGDVERGHLIFPYPGRVWRLAHDETIMPANFIRLMFPHKMLAQRVPNPFDDPLARALAATTFGADPYAQLVERGGDAHAAADMAERIDAMMTTATQATFRTEAEVGAYVKSKLERLTAQYKQKEAAGTATPAAWEKHCRAIDTVRQEGLCAFFEQVWCMHSDIAPNKKHVINWYNRHLDTAFANRARVLHEARLKREPIDEATLRPVNFSFPVVRTTWNLSRTGELAWMYMRIWSEFLGIISLQKEMTAMFLASLTVYMPSRLKWNRLVASVPGQGKSFILEALKTALIPGTVIGLDGFTQKALLRAKDMLDYVTIVFDEAPMAKIGAGAGAARGSADGGGAAAADGSSGGQITDDILTILKTAIAEGKLRYVAVETDPITKEHRPTTFVTDINAVWLMMTNNTFSQFNTAITNRLECVPIHDTTAKRYASEAQHALDISRLYDDTNDLDPLKKKMYRTAIERVKRDQCFVCIVYALIQANILNAPATAAAQAFVTSVLLRMRRATADNNNAVTRKVKRVILASTAFCVLSAVNIFLDSELSPVRDEAWNYRSLRKIQPLLVISLEHVVFILGLQSGSFENDMLREVNNVVYTSFLQRAIERKRAGESRESRESGESREHVREQKYSDERAEAAVRRAQRDADAIHVDVPNQGDFNQVFRAGVSLKPSKPAVVQQTMDKAVGAKATIKTYRPSFPGGGGGGANTLDVEEGKVFYKFVLPSCSFTESVSAFAAHRMQQQHGPLPPIAPTPPPIAPMETTNTAAQKVDRPPMKTERCQLQQFARVVLSNTRLHGVQEAEVSSVIFKMAHSMAVDVPKEFGCTEQAWPALSIDLHGTVRIAIKHLAAFIDLETGTQKSILRETVEDLVSKMIDSRTRLVYGTPVAQSTEVWDSLLVEPAVAPGTIDWTDPQELKKALDNDQVVVLHNPDYRREAEMHLTQAIADGAAAFTCADATTMSMSSFFSDVPARVCTPGDLERMATMECMTQARISMAILRDWYGVNDLLTPNFIDAKTKALAMTQFARLGKDVRRELVVYPLCYDQIAKPAAYENSMQISHYLRANPDKSTTASVVDRLELTLSLPAAAPEGTVRSAASAPEAPYLLRLNSELSACDSNSFMDLEERDHAARLTDALDALSGVVRQPVVYDDDSSMNEGGVVVIHDNDNDHDEEEEFGATEEDERQMMELEDAFNNSGVVVVVCDEDEEEEESSNSSSFRPALKAAGIPCLDME